MEGDSFYDIGHSCFLTVQFHDENFEKITREHEKSEICHEIPLYHFHGRFNRMSQWKDLESKKFRVQNVKNYDRYS